MANKKDKTAAQDNTVTTDSAAQGGAEQSNGSAPTETPAQPKSMAELNAVLDSMTPEQREELKKLQVPANVLAGTAGKYRTKDGKGVTDKRDEAKLSVLGKPIPVFTPQRPSVAGVSATHADETEQLRGRYRGGWGVQVIEACKKRAEQLKRNLTQKERDSVLNKLGDTVPKAWQPRYNKDTVTPASQYARHITVQDEFKCGILN